MLSSYFSKNYLNTIHHPEEGGIEALNLALEKLLEAGLNYSSQTYMRKFSQRLELAKGDNEK